MKKVRVYIQEILRYQRSMVIEIPDEDMNSPWDSEVEIDDFDYIK